MRPSGSLADQISAEPASMDQSPVARINLAAKLLVHAGQLPPVHGLTGLVVIAADVVGFDVTLGDVEAPDDT